MLYGRFESPGVLMQRQFKTLRSAATPSFLKRKGATGAQCCLLCLLLIGLSACAVTPPRSNPVNPSEQWPKAFQHFLSNASVGSSTFLAHSPWGAQITVYAHETYHAASGRVCRKLTITDAGMRRAGLACRLPDGSWEQVRALTRDRHPAAPPKVMPLDE